jgi:hypothetical protein
LKGQVEMQRIRNLEELLDFAAVNPGLATAMKDDPRSVANMLGVELTDEEARLIGENLDIDLVLQAAEAVDSMAAKVAQGIGLEPFRGESRS